MMHRLLGKEEKAIAIQLKKKVDKEMTLKLKIY